MAVQLIPRNDYFNMLRDGKLKGDEYDKYDILPLDLSAYHLNEVTQRIVNANFMEETMNRNGQYMLSGHWLNDLSYAFADHCNFVLSQIDGYSAYAYSDEQMAVFTYCEGDITLTPYSNREDYEAEKEATIKFYKEEY